MRPSRTFDQLFWSRRKSPAHANNLHWHWVLVLIPMAVILLGSFPSEVLHGVTLSQLGEYALAAGAAIFAIVLLTKRQHERQAAEERRNLQYVLTRILADSQTLERALDETLRCICMHLNWSVGTAWMVDGARGLWHAQGWNQPDVDVANLTEISKYIRLKEGEGLPGRIWARSNGEWVEHLGQDSGHPRKIAAMTAGMASAFGFPIKFGNQVRGILEFFSREHRETDQGLMLILEAFGSQIGQFMERERAQAELARAKEAAEISSRTKSEFLAHISHEIRTPLNTVAETIGLLIRTPLMPQQMRYVNILRSSADELLKLINHVMEFSSVDAGKLELEKIESSSPREMEDAEATPLQVGASEASPIDMERSRRPRVLVAEDDDVNRTLIREMLARDFVVDVVGNGRLAVEAELARPHDLILMDCQMPEMDGFAATREIRRAEAAGRVPRPGRRVPILGLMASEGSWELDQCVKSGMDGHLSKPIEQDKLLRGIAGSLGTIIRTRDAAA